MEQREQDEQVAVLVLEDGAVFYGRPFGAVEALAQGRRGEVVFATGMTGYQEICTDPSYRGQMVVLTYPLVGNYGVTTEDCESWRPWLTALVVREHCDEYSNWRASESLDRWLARNGIPGVCELDTRALTRHLRTHGTLRGILCAYAAGKTPDLAALVAEAQRVRTVSELDVVTEVAGEHIGPWGASAPHPHMIGPSGGGFLPGPVSGAHQGRCPGDTRCKRQGSRQGRPAEQARAAAAPGGTAQVGRGGHLGLPAGHSGTRPPSRAGKQPRGRVLLIDTGFKHNIARCLAQRGLEVLIAPPRLTLAELDALAPDGVLLANGPGDPESVAGLVALTRKLLRRKIPLMGICLGHQILGLAIGARTSRLPFGHHGANHPVLEVRTGRVTVTSQNHNFQVEAASIPPSSGFYVSHINLSDGSVEGPAHETLPVCSVQYHPEAAPGPDDNRYLFDHFAALVQRDRGRRQDTAGLAVAG